MPGTRRIFAGVGGSPGSVHALRQVARLAHHHREMVMIEHRAADTVARRGRLPDSGRWAPWRHARPPAPCATQRSPGRLA